MVDSLKKHDSFKGRQGPVVCVVLDGVGIGKHDEGDAVWKANPSNFNQYIANAKESHLYAELKAHGSAVGLPSDDDMGNSEVGHNALGAGQIYAQGAKLVNVSLDDGSFFKTDVWENVIGETAKEGKTVHFIGLLSDGNVHSHIEQLSKMLDGVRDSGVKRVRIHPLLDGRDVAPDSGLIYIDRLEKKLSELQSQGVDARIGSGGGRMHMTMDRYYSDMNMIRRGWYAHVLGEVETSDITPEYPGYFTSAKEAIEKARELFPNKKDQFNPPFVIVDEANKPIGTIEDGDAVVNFNFRGDRAIEITEAFEKEEYTHFDRKRFPKVRYAGLLQYDADAGIPANFLVPPPTIRDVSGEYLVDAKIKSYAIAETHKYGHVTYFWNGNRSGYLSESLEKYEEVKSDPNDMVESRPEMKAREVTDKLLSAINSDEYKFLRVNYANGDMVGHTGNIEACVTSIKVVDECLKEVVDATLAKNGVVLVTADHGNSEQKIDKKGKVMTSHTLNAVPFFIIDSGYQGEYSVDVSGITEPGIANVASTFMNLLGFEAPAQYEKSLISFK